MAGLRPEVVRWRVPLAVIRRPTPPIGRSTAKDADYEEKIKGLDWTGLRLLFAQIEARNTPGWEPGRAFEFLVPRAFELDGARVRWPYAISLHGYIVEQIDGAVESIGLHCLL